MRIGEKIRANDIEENGPFRIEDMIRAKITIQSFAEVIEAYQILLALEEFEILKI